MRLVWLLCSLTAAALAQDQTLSLGITATATPTASLPITPPPQRTLATCSSDPLWRRLRNAEGQDPCELAMNLQRTCTIIDPIPAITGGESYTGPTSVEAATPCICTTVMYNLVAGCAACQHQRSNNVSRNWVPWSTWSALCQNRGQIVDGAWGRATLYNSTIPSWAYVKVFQNDWFDLQQAVNIGVTSTSAAPSATSSAPASHSSSNKNNAKVGAIVGGVLGGVALILLLITCFFLFLRRRQRRWEEAEGVNKPVSSPYMQGKPAASLQKPTGPYGPGGLLSPTRGTYQEKPRPLQTESALPDVVADEHRQGKPDYPYGGFGGYGGGERADYAPVPNPGPGSGVAGVGAGGRGLAAPIPVHRVPPKNDMPGLGPPDREGIFKEDFSASEGHGYRSSNDAESRHFRNPSNGFGNGNGRGPHPPSSFPPSAPGIPRRTGGGIIAPMGTLPAERPDEDVHAYSTVGDASISLYPSEPDQHTSAPPPFVGGFMSPPAEKEEYRLPERGYSVGDPGYSSGYVIPVSGGSGGSGNGSGSGGQNSPGLDADPFAANRRPAAFNRVFGERTSPTTATGNIAGVGRGTSAGPASTAKRGSGSPLFMRNPPPSVLPRRGTGSQDMGFGRQVGGVVTGGRDSSAFSEESSPTAVGGSPVPTGPFAGRSGFGVGR